MLISKSKLQMMLYNDITVKVTDSTIPGFPVIVEIGTAKFPSGITNAKKTMQNVVDVATTIGLKINIEAEAKYL